MENILYDKRLLSEVSEDIPEDDPFYSEENVKDILESYEQIRRGEYEKFNLHEYLRRHNLV